MAQVFKAQEIDASRKGWVADMNKGGPINPDLYWYFKTKRQAQRFVELVEGGVRADEAAYTIAEESQAATILGSKGGQSTSAAKAAAARRNGRKGGRPRKND